RRHNLLQHNRRHTALRPLNAPSHHSTAPAALANACEATPGSQEHSEPEAKLQSLNPTCRHILNTVTDRIQPLKHTWD
ncbi:hypothetical protein ACWDU9_31975, partial [Streptomyces cellulosae]